MKKHYLLGIIAVCWSAGVFSQTTITINPSTVYQTMRGMGGAGVVETGYDGYVRGIVDLMGATAYRHYMDGNASGSALTLAQINAGTYNFTDNASVANFYKALKAKGLTFIVSTCWSPPACLKQNNCVCQKYLGIEANCCQGTAACGAYNCADDNNYLLSTYYDEYGKFLAAWIKDFQLQTTQTLYAFNIQNEPFFNEPYPSAKMFDNAFGACNNTVRTELTAAGLSGLKLFGPEDMGNYSWMSGGTPNRAYIKSLLWNSTNRANLDVFAVHSYTDGIQADLGSADGWTRLDTAVRKYTKVGLPMELWMSETDFQGTCDWNMAFDMAKQIFVSLKYGKINAWIYWGMDGSNGMFTGGSPTPRLYSCMHFMRFIRPGYQHIQCTESDADIAAVAFKNGSDFTVVVMNLNASATKTVTFNSFTGTPGYFDMYRSMARNATEMEKCAYVGRVTNNSFSIPAKSIVTLYFKASEPNVYWGVQPPTNLVSSNITDNTFKVSWTPPAGYTLAGTPVSITGYVVYLNGVKKTMTPTSNAYYNFTGLTKNTNYTVVVYTRDALYGESVAAKIVVTTTCTGCTEPPPPPPVDDIKDEKMVVSVSPNPSSEAITVALPDENIYSVSIISLSGNVVVQKQVKNNDRIDVSGLAKGIYLLMAQDEAKVLKTKIAVE